MTGDIENLVLEHLRAIRTDVADVKDRLGRVELGLSKLGQQVGALTTAVYSGRSELDDFRRRIERIERRLARLPQLRAMGKGN
jgi:predicted  nucleic acid-binding Zn-ribbon protein